MEFTSKAFLKIHIELREQTEEEAICKVPKRRKGEIQYLEARRLGKQSHRHVYQARLRPEDLPEFAQVSLKSLRTEEGKSSPMTSKKAFGSIPWAVDQSVPVFFKECMAARTAWTIATQETNENTVLFHEHLYNF